jgi:predicted RNA methylase
MGWIYWSGIIGAGWSPTPMENVKKMLKMAEVGKDDVVYDLGCGDGRIIAIAAGEFGVRAVGIEADPLRFLFSFVRIKVSGLGNKAKVIWRDFFRVNLEEATVVTVFLSNKANSKLKEKLQRELSPGTRVISYYWIFDGWKPVKINPSSHLYMYQIED